MRRNLAYWTALMVSWVVALGCGYVGLIIFLILGPMMGDIDYPAYSVTQELAAEFRVIATELVGLAIIGAGSDLFMV
jgi:hypothetical protein